MSSVASAAGSARSTPSVLHEPLLNPRRPWDEEFTHPNGRGRAALTSFLLGIGAGGALLPLVTAPAAAPFCAYAILLIVFHFSEYALTAAFRPDTLGYDNFLLNHSTAYQACVLAAWLEYWLEYCLVGAWWPGGKQWGALNSFGLFLCLLGLCSRSLGMATASTNFSHKIEDTKRAEHQLVTHGIYAWLAHIFHAPSLDRLPRSFKSAREKAIPPIRIAFDGRRLPPRRRKRATVDDDAGANDDDDDELLTPPQERQSRHEMLGDAAVSAGVHDVF